MRLTELAYVWDILSQQEQMGCTIGLFLAVLTKNLMTMVTALLLCMAVWLHFEHSEPAVKSIFGCTNQKSYDGHYFTTMHGCFTMFWTFGASNKI